MKKTIALFMCLFLLISIPINILAEEDAPAEEITENEEITELDYDDLMFIDIWLVPLSSQIKVSFGNKSTDVFVDIYISDNAEDYEFVATTNEPYYLIDNLKHRGKYTLKFVTRYNDYESFWGFLEVRTK